MVALFIFIVVFAPVVYAMYGIRIHCYGVKNRGSLAQRKPVVYLANHSSTLDFVTCSRSLSTGTIAIAKKELLAHPLGWISWLNGTVFIDRSDRAKAIASMNSAARQLRQFGVSVFALRGGRCAD